MYFLPRESLFQITLIACTLLYTGSYALATEDYTSLVLADAPFAYYDFGETTGVVAIDWSGNHPGTYVNAPVLGETGLNGIAVGLNGLSVDPSHVLIADGLSDFGSRMNQFTFETVFRTPAGYTGQGCLLHMTNITPDKTGFSVWFNSDLIGQPVPNCTRLFLRDSESSNISGVLYDDLFDGAYHHLMVTYNSSDVSTSKRLKAYLDGSPITLTFGNEGVPTQFTNLSTPVTIGALIDGVSFPAEACVDEVAFYDVVLGEADAQARSCELGLSPSSINGILDSGIAVGDVQNRRYLSYVTEALDTLMEHGTDRYGTTNESLLVSIIDVCTKKVVCPLPVDQDWRVTRPERRSPNGNNFLHDQDLLRVLRSVSTITGQQRYEDFAENYSAAAMNITDENGMFWWGWHRHYDVTTEEMTGHLGNYHEIHSIIHPDWEYLWSVNPEGVNAEIEQIWQRHVVNKTTGEINRHSDGQPGLSFIMSSGAFIEAFAEAYDQTGDYIWLERAKLLAEYNWNHRDTTTNLLASAPNEMSRWDGFRATTSLPGLYAPSLLIAWQATGDTEFRDQAMAYLKAYAEYAYDDDSGSFWSSLKLDGTPVDEPRIADGSYDQYEPRGLVDLWQPYVAGYEQPIATAQAYAMAYKLTGDADMLDSAEKWAAQILANFPADETLQDTWYDGYSDDFAEYGTYAENYGRVIHFFLDLAEATEDGVYIENAKMVADEAVANLWYEGLFRGHQAKPYYEAIDGVGLLMDSLVRLDQASRIPGDANNDGKVDGSDVTILAGYWQVGVDDAVEATWEMGDFNGDKKVDGSDVTILANNWQTGVTAAAAFVSEPSGNVLLATSLIGLLAYVWRKRVMLYPTN